MHGINRFENNLFELIVNTEKGEPLFDVETVAKSLGFTEFKNDKEYVRWRTINGYLKKIRFARSCERRFHSGVYGL